MKYIKAIIGVVFLVILDQITKWLAVKYLMPGGPKVLIENVFELRYLENRGMAFGMMQNQKVFFVIMTLIIVAALVVFYAKVPDTKRMLPMRILAVCIMAGALGNFIDRVRQSYVVDFFYFKLIDFPIFNVADIYVTVSAIVFLVLVLFYYKEDDYAFLSRKKKADAGKAKDADSEK